MKLSIITINYNNRDGLRKTIESVVNQTWQEFEYIIIDGGSTDDSVDVIKEYADRIDYWVSEPDKGIYDAMNKGIDQAKGEYCLFMNSADTIYETTTLEGVYPQLDGTDIVSGNLICDKKLSKSPISVDMYMLYVHTLPHQATFIKRKLFDIYPYDTKYKIVSDSKFWIQTLVFGNAGYKHIDYIIADFDVYGISSTNEPLRVTEKQQVLAELLPPRVLSNYYEIAHGGGFKEIPENQFYIHLMKYKYGILLYSLLVFLCRIISFIRPSARFAWDYPLFRPFKIQR